MNELRYNHIIGTGGIGSGMFFSLSGDHTLGRNESRAATLLPYRDYCKQHIILHYISVLMGAASGGRFQVFPIGAVGDDDAGKKLLREMEAVGMHMKNIYVNPARSTLFSVCFQYPDHSGGNITTDNSASSRLSAENIEQFFTHCSLEGMGEIVLAAPEVPVEVRIALLQHGRQRGSLNVAAVLSAETQAFRQSGGFKLTDVLSINMDEARSIAGLKEENIAAEQVVDACVDRLLADNSGIVVLFTDGANGSYCYKDNYLEHVPVLKTRVVSTAGAGDAFLAGTITGICCGLPLVKGAGDSFFGESPLDSAIELGTLLASLSVNSSHTIHPEADAQHLYQFAQDNELRFGKNFSKLFKTLVK